MEEILPSKIEFQKLLDSLITLRQKIQKNPNIFFESLPLDVSQELELVGRGNKAVALFFKVPVYQEPCISLLKRVQEEAILCESLISSKIKQSSLSEKMTTPEFRSQFPAFCSFYYTLSALNLYLSEIFENFESYLRVGGRLPLTEEQLVDFLNRVGEDVEICSLEFQHLATADFSNSGESKENFVSDSAQKVLQSLVNCSNGLKDSYYLLSECLKDGMVFSEDSLSQIEELHERLPWVFLEKENFVTNPPEFFRTDSRGVEWLVAFQEAFRNFEKSRSSLLWKLYRLLEQYEKFPDSPEKALQAQKMAVNVFSELNDIVLEVLAKVEKEPSCLLTAQTDKDFISFHQKIGANCFLWNIVINSRSLSKSLEVEKAFDLLKTNREQLFNLIDFESSRNMSGIVSEILNMLSSFYFGGEDDELFN